MQEQRLLKFYEELVTLSQKDLLMSHMFFEEVATSMLFGHEMEENDLMSIKAYEMILLWNITYINYNDGVKSQDLLAPFSNIDFDYYYGLMNYYVKEGFIELLKINMVAEITNDLENTQNSFAHFILKEANPGFLEAFNNFSGLKEIIRKGWVKRNVKEEYLESDATHSMQMFALASAYFRIYGSGNIDVKKVYEMIIIHEIGEILAGDIVEGAKEHLTKHDIEAKCVKETFKNLKCGQYFIDLWEEFEARETEKAQFVYMLDKLDPVLKAKFLDKTLNRDDLFEDFYVYEEKRETFNSSANLHKLFYALKDYK